MSSVVSKQKSVDSVVTVCSLDMDMTDHEPGPGPAAPHQTVFTHSYTPHTDTPPPYNTTQESVSIVITKTL